MESNTTENPSSSGEPDAENPQKMNDTDTKEVKKKKVTKIKDAGKKKTKRGVVYLSCIPQSMSVKRLREEMDKYGETGNIFLQPDGNQFGNHAVCTFLLDSENDKCRPRLTVTVSVQNFNHFSPTGIGLGPSCPYPIPFCRRQLK